MHEVNLLLFLLRYRAEHEFRHPVQELPPLRPAPGESVIPTPPKESDNPLPPDPPVEGTLKVRRLVEGALLTPDGALLTTDGALLTPDGALLIVGAGAARGVFGMTFGALNEGARWVFGTSYLYTLACAS